MFSNKLPLFICFTLLLFNLSATNGSSDDEDNNRKFKKLKKIYSDEPSSLNYINNDYVTDEEFEDEEFEDEEFEDEEVEEYKDNNVNTRGEGSSRTSKSYKAKLDQIKKCQEKLFGNEQPGIEYYLNDKKAKEIIEYYKNINNDFKKAADSFLNLRPHLRKNYREVFL